MTKVKTQCREDLCKYCWKNMTLRDYWGNSWGHYCLEAVQGAIDGIFSGPVNDASCFEPRKTKSVKKMIMVAELFQAVKDNKI